jgi:hypothetical protein
VASSLILSNKNAAEAFILPGRVHNNGAAAANMPRKMLQQDAAVGSTACNSDQGGVSVHLTNMASTSSNGQSFITGSVNLVNGGSSPLPLDTVIVTLTNSDAATAPITVPVICPASAVPGAAGQITCTFTFALPTSSPASLPNSWTAARADVALATPVPTTCRSDVTTIAATQSSTSRTANNPTYTMATTATYTGANGVTYSGYQPGTGISSGSSMILTPGGIGSVGTASNQPAVQVTTTTPYMVSNGVLINPQSGGSRRVVGGK